MTTTPARSSLASATASASSTQNGIPNSTGWLNLMRRTSLKSFRSNCSPSFPIRCIGQRVDELEAAFAEQRERLVALARASATEAPTLADVAPVLDRLPILATSLGAAPHGELRALFDSLHLDIVYQPADSSIDVAATLYDLGSETAQSAARESTEDWSAPPAGLEPALPAPEAGALSAELRGHAAARCP